RPLRTGGSFDVDRLADIWDGGQPLRPGVTVSGTIGRFSPMDVSGEVWRRIEPVVKHAVTTSDPETPFLASHQLSIVTHMAVWADLIGQPLETEYLFTPEFIDRFIIEGCAHLTKGT